MTTPLLRKLHLNAFGFITLFLLLTSQVFCQSLHPAASLVIISASCSNLCSDSGKLTIAFDQPQTDLTDIAGIVINRAETTPAESVKFKPKLKVAHLSLYIAQVKPLVLAFVYVLVKLNTLFAPARGIIGLFY
jgi:hypothetical protein